MKYLASRANSNIFGPYRGVNNDMPLSGYMVFDVPDSLGELNISSPGIGSLVSEKYSKTQQHFPTLPNIIYEEFTSLSAPFVGPPSSGYFGAPQKKFALRKSGGFAFFGPYVMPGPFVANLVARFGAYKEIFVASSTESVTTIDTNVSPSLIQIDITDMAGVVQQTMSNDQVVPISFFPGFPFNFLIKVTNLSSFRVTLSDFCLLWG